MKSCNFRPAVTVVFSRATRSRRRWVGSWEDGLDRAWVLFWFSKVFRFFDLVEESLFD